jgi:ribosomal protein L37E
MALIKCVECGKEISDMSENCPNCGCPTQISIEKIKYNDKLFYECPVCGKKYNDGTLKCSLCGYAKIAKKTTQSPQQQNIPQQKVPHCPKCGSTSISTGARGVNHFWGFIGASQTVNRCANCGHTWKPNGK